MSASQQRTLTPGTGCSTQMTQRSASHSFLTYIGGNNKRKLSQIVAQTPYPIKAELRDGRRMKPWRWELKIWGLSWADAQNLAADLDPLGFDASVRLENVETAA